MEDYKIFEKEEFGCLTQKQKEILMTLPQNLKGKSSVEAAGIIMRTISLLEAEGKLTPQQKRAMALCVTENMSDEERKRAAAVLRLMGMG